MAGAVYPSGIVNGKGETLALSSALASLGIPGIETKQAVLYNSQDFRLHINPAILEIYFYDNSQTGVAKWVNLKTPGKDLTDRTTTGSGTSLDTITADDRLLICFSDVAGGVRVDMNDSSVNGEANRVMVCEYPIAAAWTGLTEDDGTILATAKSLGIDGSVTWTAVTDWSSNHFGVAQHKYGAELAIDDVDTGIDIGTDPGTTTSDIVMDADPSTAILAGDYIIVDTEVMYVNTSSASGNIVNVIREVLGSTIAAHTAGANVFIYRFDCPAATRGFWLKMNWTGGSLGSDVEIQNLWALNKDTDRLYMQAGVNHHISFDRRVTGAIEAVMDSGNTIMKVNWIRTSGGG